jgi:hypothetical protein
LAGVLALTVEVGWWSCQESLSPKDQFKRTYSWLSWGIMVHPQDVWERFYTVDVIIHPYFPHQPNKDISSDFRAAICMRAVSLAVPLSDS